MALLFTGPNFTHVDTPTVSSDPINQKLHRHRWDSEDREILCLLYRLYENPIRDKSAIFNYLCRSRLDQEGFQNGLSSKTLTAQWHDMRVGANGNDLWRKINIDQSLAECRSQYRYLENSIEDAAFALGLDLCLRIQPTGIVETDSCRLGTRVRSIGQLGARLTESKSAAEDAQSERNHPNRQYQTQSAGEVLGMSLRNQANTQGTVSPLAPVDEGTPLTLRHGLSSSAPGGKAVRYPRVEVGSNSGRSKDTPRLLFRFSDDLSAAKGPFLKNSMGFVAGSFVNSPHPTPVMATEILKAVALLHLTPAQRISHTPFISFFSGMLAPFHRALRFAGHFAFKSRPS